MTHLVIVESPAKAKTINKYLGNDYLVLASFGHVRDLPSKTGSVDPENHFSMVWESDARSKKQIADIEKAVRQADSLILATDPDREGEAISWHVLEVLREKRALKNIPVKRVVFYEITKPAILEAMKNPRDLDQDLIEAYLARRALDYLVGFTLSPVLWRKLPGSRSAGRVQSVALRLIADRELEIEAFRSEEYWTIDGQFEAVAKKSVLARLTHLQSRKLEKFTINSKTLSDQALKEIEGKSYSVVDIEKKQSKRNPTAPFITSTLQQEAARKLGFSARKTMQVAQQLYEGIKLGGEVTGLITYMRTDSITVSQQAVFQARDYIKKEFGDRYLPSSPRMYKSKSKNAQEAHEAIRPTDLFRHPNAVAGALDKDQLKLYTLIWKRMISSQMASAELDQTAVVIGNPEKSILFRATGTVITFDGFLKLYEESLDDTKEEDGQRLPAFSVGESVDLKKLLPEQHFTQPPPRYTEASLVKKLEELGIGRPSTYASIIQTLLDRDYVKRDKKQLVPEPRGRVVTGFLTNYFSQYVEYDFTAKLEDQLDDISSGNLNWEKVLTAFWEEFIKTVDLTKELRVSDVLDKLNELLGVSLFGEGENARKCPDCKDGMLSLKLGKFGAFIGCSNYPECKHTRQLGGADKPEDGESMEAADGAPKFETRILGDDPKTGLSVTVRKGPYGFYIQWGEAAPKQKPKRVAVPKNADPLTIDLEHALSLGALPREVGKDPVSGELITAAIGRFGPYVKLGGTFASIPKTEDPLTIDLTRALELFEEAKNKPKRAPKTAEKEGEETVKKGAKKPAAKKAKTKKSSGAKGKKK